MSLQEKLDIEREEGYKEGYAEGYVEGREEVLLYVSEGMSIPIEQLRLCVEKGSKSSDKSDRSPKSEF